MAHKGGLSDYELMIKKNQERKMAILEQIGITDVKRGAMKTVRELTSAKKRRKLEKKQREPQELRRSLRLISNGPGPVMSDELCLIEEEVIEEEEESIRYLESFDFNDVCVGEETPAEFFKEMDFSIKSPKSLKREHLSKMKLKYIETVVPKRISAMDIHPSPHKILIAAGSSKGNLGFWSIESESKIVVLKPHYGIITSLAFNPMHHNQLISTSYDGTMHCADLTEHKFNRLYSTKQFCSSFDFITPTAYIISHTNGTVVIVDSRSNSMKHVKRQCNKDSLNSVSVHPGKNHFLTACSNGSVRLWDLRNLKNRAITDLRHESSVKSAYFSPTSGNHIVTVSTNDKLSIYESTKLSSIKLKRTRKHNSPTSNRLTSFRATWLPGFEEELFVIGNKKQYIEVYGIDGKRTHVFVDKGMKSMTPLNVFHPTQLVLAGGNSVGKVYIFTDSM